MTRDQVYLILSHLFFHPNNEGNSFREHLADFIGYTNNDDLVLNLVEKLLHKSIN
jgi:hypothetical protein